MKALPISEHGKKLAQRVARHEAGHWIVARVLGFNVGECSLILNGNGGYRGGAATTLVESAPSAEKIITYLERRVQVLYAGALAETLNQVGDIDRDEAINQLRNGAATDDYSKARELISLLRNIKFAGDQTEKEAQAHLDALDKELWDKAANCVLTDRDVIMGLGGRLFSKLKFFDVPAILTADAINALPSIAVRFGSPSR